MTSNFLNRESLISSNSHYLEIEKLEILFNNAFNNLSSIASEHSQIKEKLIVENDELKIIYKGKNSSELKTQEQKINALKKELSRTQDEFHENIVIMEKTTKGFIDYLRNNKIKNYNGLQSLIDLHKKLEELTNSKNKYDLISAFETLVSDKKIFEEKSALVNGHPAVYSSGGILRKKVLKWAAIAALSAGVAFGAFGQSNAQEQQKVSKDYYGISMPSSLKTDSTYIEFEGSANTYFNMQSDKIINSQNKTIDKDLFSDSGKLVHVKFDQGYYTDHFYYSVNNKKLSVKIPAGDVLLVYVTRVFNGANGATRINYRIFSKGQTTTYSADGAGRFDVGDNDLIHANSGKTLTEKGQL